ncbi:MAG: LacI family transcriptional regulator, partial [Nitriliruptorales bacterium]|nr:LacI family transcriptional regulator [Nitriliruptorales bacterium]
TTVRQPVADMVDSAVNLLLARIDDPDKPPEHIRYPSELIIRGSTANRSAAPQHC